MDAISNMSSSSVAVSDDSETTPVMSSESSDVLKSSSNKVTQVFN